MKIILKCIILHRRKSVISFYTTSWEFDAFRGYVFFFSLLSSINRNDIANLRVMFYVFGSLSKIFEILLTIVESLVNLRSRS
jgi:hypothetical protein